MKLGSEADTQQFAKEIATRISPGLTVALNGPLGAGKTTFVRYLVKELGSVMAISSPTFVLCHEYKLPSGVRVEHWDLYRVAALPEEFSEPPGADTIRIVEWAEKFPSFSEGADLEINFSLVASEEGDLRRDVEVRDRS